MLAWEPVLGWRLFCCAACWRCSVLATARARRRARPPPPPLAASSSFSGCRQRKWQHSVVRIIWSGSHFATLLARRSRCSSAAFIAWNIACSQGCRALNHLLPQLCIFFYTHSGPLSVLRAPQLPDFGAWQMAVSEHTGLLGDRSARRPPSSSRRCTPNCRSTSVGPNPHWV